MPEGIWVVNPEGQTIFSNRRMAELLGVAFETMPEQSCFACVFPEEAEDASGISRARWPEIHGPSSFACAAPMVADLGKHFLQAHVR